VPITDQTTPRQAATVRRAVTADRPDVTRTLTSAFVDDPVFSWLIPDPAQRAVALPAVFAAYADAFARHDETLIGQQAGGTGRATTGVAMWAPPGTAPIDAAEEGRFGARIVDAAAAHLGRFVACGDVFGAAHPHEPCWYLQFLGVDPAHQGRSHGSALLRATLARADRDGRPAYLEATSRRNRAFYERHGFRCVADLVLPDGPTAFAMWREPR
jgi:GNAT superfamily N-acetyltransferase